MKLKKDKNRKKSKIIILITNGLRMRLCQVPSGIILFNLF